MSRYADYQSVAAIFDAMQTESVDGLSVAEMVGGGYPMPVAAHFMDLLRDQADLARGDRVLDIGCGCGRLAAALTQHIGSDGAYTGVDIVAGLIDFANRHIAPRFANFRFLTLTQDNPAYDQWRHDGTSSVIASITEACAPGTIDLCVATSLFTHLDTTMARQMLKDIATALHPDGRILISLFLLDTGARALIQQGAAAFGFEHPYEVGAYVQSPAGPLGAIAFTYEHFVKMLTAQRLYVERVLYGSWAGRSHHVSGQDILIIRKMPAAGHAPHNGWSDDPHPTVPSDADRDLVAENAQLTAEMDAVHASRSWRITAPLRTLSRLLGRR